MGTARLRIRDGQSEDASFLVRCNARMALETEDLELDEARLRSGVRSALRDGGKGSYLIAELGGEPAGVLLVTREWSDWRDGWFWWIQSVFVEESARGQGVYRALHDEVRCRARAEGAVVGIRLYVDADNERAQAVYRALGMRATRYRLFEEEL